MIAIYILCILTVAYMLFAFSNSKENYSLKVYYFLIVILISDFGSLALALSKNIEEAVLANKICYVSGAFAPLLLFLIVCEVCHVKVHRGVVALLSAIQVFLFVMICSIGITDWYYKAAELHINSAGVSFLTKTYGTFHVLYPLTMYGYFLVSIILACLSLFRRNLVSYKNIVYLVTGFLLGVCVYAGERILKFDVELVPIMNTIVLIFIATPVYRINKYFIDDNIQKVSVSTNKNSYISFDKKYNYTGSNEFAQELFPEIKIYKMDSPVPYTENMISRKVIPMLEEYSRLVTSNATEEELREASHKQFEMGYQTYECSINPVHRDQNELIGYLVEFKDVTEDLKTLRIAEDYNRNLESEVLGKTQRIREIQDRTVLGMAQMVESRDLSTGGHIKRTSSVVNVFASELKKSDLGLSNQFLSYVAKSAPMHDLGKIAVDDQVLRKPGRFTDEEYEKMKIHSSEGARVVREILTGVEDEEFMNIAINVAHYHHEKVDGSGYPEGLKGDEIPIEARIMALADVFDALVSKRCYKDSFSYDKAFSIIEESAGSHFDANLVKIFLKCRPRLETLYNSFE